MRGRPNLFRKQVKKIVISNNVTNLRETDRERETP